MIKAVELYEASKLPMKDVMGRPIDANFMADNENRNKTVKWFSPDFKDMMIVVEFYEDEEVAE